MKYLINPIIDTMKYILTALLRVIFVIIVIVFALIIYLLITIWDLEFRKNYNDFIDFSEGLFDATFKSNSLTYVIDDKIKEAIEIINKDK